MEVTPPTKKTSTSKTPPATTQAPPPSKTSPPKPAPKPKPSPKAKEPEVSRRKIGKSGLKLEKSIRQAIVGPYLLGSEENQLACKEENGSKWTETRNM